MLAGVVALVAAAAQAADMPVKAPILTAPLPTWTGFYAGVNAGYSFGHDIYDDIRGVDSGLTSIAAPSGAVLGGQLGYNWQLGPVVLGLEGDAQWTGQDGTGCAAVGCIVNQVPESTVHLIEHRLEWFSTLRGRVGWANEGWLFYVTGGGALAGVRETDTTLFDFIPSSDTFNRTLSGWAGGLGAETRLSRNWILSLEYLHLDLGRMTNVGVNNAQVTTSRVTDNITRIGFNYQLAATPGEPWTQAYASAAPLAAFNWTGLYVGANGGYGVGHNKVTQVDDLTFLGAGVFDASYAPATIGPRGGLVGGQAGYNWQVNHIVLGFEGDAQWSNMHETACGFDCGADGAGFISQKLKWFSTARARLGWAMPSWMLYGTAGGAWGGIDETDTIGFFKVAATSFNHTQGGWTAGCGIELRLSDRWTGKLEYLHLDLGTTTNVASSASETLTTTSDIRSDIVRLGLNYKLWD